MAPGSYVAALQLVKKTLEKHGVALRLGKGHTVNLGNKERVKGYFDSEGKAVSVATSGNPFLVTATLLHEMAHVEQWAEAAKGYQTKGAQIWRAATRTKAGTRLGMLSDMLLELDAERRTLKRLEDLGVGTKAERLQYAREAALYVWTYHVRHLEQKRFKSSVYLTNEAVGLKRYLPTNLRGRFLKAPPEPLYSIIASWLK